ncbi:hypothetical protein M9Y10_004280 [Tritrichomonas musculus]|uniref:Uncharacterized protein n=1 Tax=Tritrichomonas musculus TaxID=1915356 RepID=A0ABR2JSX0_9EUKA
MIQNFIYKFPDIEPKGPVDTSEQETISSVDQILNKLILSFNQYSFNDLIHSISELNRYMKCFEIDINDFNSKQVNIIFYVLLSDDTFTIFFDNIIRTLKALVLIPGFDISPFENIQFFRNILFSVTPSIKYPSNGILLLASILDASRNPRSIMVDSDIISFLFNIAFTNEAIKKSIFSFFASLLIILDNEMKNYLKDITPFFYQVMAEKITSPNILLDYFEILLQRIPVGYVTECLANQIDFTPFLEKCQSNDKYDQIATLKLVLLLLEIQCQAMYNQIDLKYFLGIFEKECCIEADKEEGKLTEKILILFFKIASKTFHLKPSINDYINQLLQFSMYAIDQTNFKLKKASLTFLTKLIPAKPDVLHKLIELNFISILSQYLECTGDKIKNVIIKSLLYILFSVSQEDEENVYTIMEEEEIWKKINDIDADEISTNTEAGEAKTCLLIDEFNVLYEQLSKKIQYNSNDRNE